MAIILFLMDTSGSMNQRTSLGQTYLDMGKTAIESFLKIRQKAADSWKDRYMLVTCEEFPEAVKVGWRENGSTPNDNTVFLQELKQLVAVNMTNIGGAMKCSLDLLNLHRLTNGHDNYGQGRNPYLLEPAVIIVISDGCKLSTSQTVADELILPMHSSYPGSELTKEPFRWDQRIFSMVLRFKGNCDSDFSENINCESHVKLMCDVTGGKSYVVSSLKALNQSLESISQKILSGVVLNLEKLLSEAERGLSTEVWHSTRRMILVKPTTQKIAHWPIPESFWPTRDAKPVRMAIPTIHFKCDNKAVNVIEHLPFDKYELEPSPLTQQILELRLPNTCWQTFVMNSSKDKGVKHTFGYLKASIKGTCVNLFVMPYNYPTLFPLLEELLNELKMIPTGKWMNEFKSYISTVPQYYYQPLRTALRRLGVPGSLITLIPETTDTLFQNYLKKLKDQGRAEAVRFIEQIKTAKENAPKKISIPRKFVDIRAVVNELSLQKAAVNTACSIIKNPYHTDRSKVLSQLNLLRKEIGVRRSGSTCTSEHSRFHLPINKMGLYQDSISKQLRVVECSTSQKTNHTFGNPFKLGHSKEEKKLIADEMDGKEPTPLENPPLKPLHKPSTLTKDGKPLTLTMIRKPSTLTKDGKPLTLTMIRKPSTLTKDGKPLTLTMIRKSPTLTTDRKPLSVSTDKKPLSLDPMIRKPLALTMDRKPPTASTDRKPLTVNTDRKPLSVNTDKKPLTFTPMIRNPHTLTTDRKPLAVTMDRKPHTASTDRKPLTVSTDRKPLSVNTDKKPLTLTPMIRNPLTLTTDRKPLALTMDRKLLTASTDHRKPLSVSTDRKPRTGTMDKNILIVPPTKQMNNVMADEMDEFGNMQRNAANKRRHVPLKHYQTPPNSATAPISPVIINLDPTPPLANMWNSPSPISNNVAPAPILSNNKPRAPTPPPVPNKLPPVPPINSIPLPRPPPPVIKPQPPPVARPPPSARPQENNKTKDKSKPVTPFPNWFLSTQSSDIAAAIGSGNDEATTEPPSKKLRQDILVKENHNVTVNPSMKESFLKLSDTESFIDKNKIKDNFGGEVNGDSHLQSRREEEVKPKRSKAISQDDLRRDNKRLKDAISKELRKPGKNYDQLFHHLNQVRGGAEVKRKLSEEVISDALKFKKKNLVEQLKAWQKKLPNR